ncbi:hypothetical protein Fmac_016201 [Flemingia macrophylla]|uniref:Uncharacterized protein n=1 Tax=Flemingia macrophylla TaxID=520843 RepID=A0ABD1MGS3_9FABA
MFVISSRNGSPNGGTFSGQSKIFFLKESRKDTINSSQDLKMGQVRFMHHFISSRSFL